MIDAYTIADMLINKQIRAIMKVNISSPAVLCI